MSVNPSFYRFCHRGPQKIETRQVAASGEITESSVVQVEGPLDSFTMDTAGIFFSKIVGIHTRYIAGATDKDLEHRLDERLDDYLDHGISTDLVLLYLKSSD